MRKLNGKERKYYIKLLKRTLKQIDAFTKLPLDLVEKITNRAEIRLYQEDETVITQFSEGNEFYLILDGIVMAYDTSKDEPQRLNGLKKGDFFGERALLLHERRIATCQAIIDTYLACFDQEVWDLLEKEAPTVMTYFREMGKNYKLTITKLPSGSQKVIHYYSCFISYSSQDEAFAQRLHADLQESGVRC